MMICPCGTQLPYEECCAKYIEDKQLPQTPEALMRSRYSAFTLGKMDYIAATMRKDTLKKFDTNETTNWLKTVVWQKLVVLNQTFKTPKRGFVTFEAHYLFNNQPQILSEKSEFQKIGNQWFYVDGKTKID